ncbi:hypothetical protein AVEN_151171-1 [Araneus ventricosus]|uniref:Uncharacterized protein n=1 Tax=Araneus ventricosus TaxID=182803 RepID=A0A4Y2MPZ3_ARAVE|nr:hypothetical protein AVEN_151171-1 [Araneus ventricosus]
MLCSSKKASTYLYISHEFQALPSINSFPSKPIRDSSYSSKNLVCCLLFLSHPTTEPSTSEIQNHRGRTECLDTDILHLRGNGELLDIGQRKAKTIGTESKCLKPSEKRISASLDTNERKCTPSEEVALTSSKVDRCQ